MNTHKSKPLERECQFRVLTVKAWRYPQRATPDYLAASVEEKIKICKKEFNQIREDLSHNQNNNQQQI